jgi:GGDEF domain-containing protein
MISIRESISELENKEQLRALAQDCYLSAIQSLVQYTIELEGGITNDYRKRLTALEAAVASGQSKAIEESRATLRGVLREYRDKANQYLNGLRSELGRTADGLQRMVDALGEGDDDHESKLKRAIRTLQEISVNPAAGVLGPSIRSTCEAMEQTVGQFRQHHLLIVSQMVTEIGLLHKRIDALESAISAGDLMRLFTRPEMEHRIRSATTPGSLLLLRVEGIERAAAQFNPDVAQQLAAAFIKRLKNNLVPEAIIGSWTKEGFLVMHPAAKSDVQIAAQWITQHLSGAYACLHGAKSVRPRLEVKVNVLEFCPGEGAEQTFEQVSRIFE